MKGNEHPLVLLADRAVRSRNLLPGPGAGVIVGLSGGADSVALLAVLTELGYDCAALHVNYGLRGKESLRDEQHAADVARTLGADIEIVRKHPGNSHGMSVEMSCREIRYAEMERMRVSRGAVAVAVAHHREDQAETFFLNLLRGSGTTGLRGMKWRRGNVIRPLLGADRRTIEDYLEQRGLTWVDDSSNATDDYQRNRVRHNVIPALQSVRTDALDGLLRSMDFLAEADTLLASMAAERAAHYSADGALDVKALLDSESHPAAMLYLILSGKGFNRATTDGILTAARGTGSRTFRSADSRKWELSAGILRPVTEDPAPASVSGPLNKIPLIVDEITPDMFTPRRDPAVMYLDGDKAAGGLWELRGWQPGDRIEPFGMSGSRTVSDILAEAGITASQRRHHQVLLRDGLVIWVVGVRAARHFTVTPSTRRILRLKAPHK